MAFTVQYAGAECVDCGQELRVGCQATYVGESELAHVSCPPPPTVCPVHFIQLPPSGVCDDCA